MCYYFFFSSRRRHTRYISVTGVQTCALPIYTRQATAVADRIRRKVDERDFITPEGKIRITISVGVVSFPECAVENQVELVQLADAALYKAKETGRNKVIACGRTDEA